MTFRLCHRSSSWFPIRFHIAVLKRAGLLPYLWENVTGLKTTVEIPDALFRKAKATAAERGVPLKDLLTDAVREHLRRSAGDSSKSNPPAPAPAPLWMSAFGGLRALHQETKRINRVLEQEFERIEKHEWR
jgi:hypothetical protein